MLAARISLEGASEDRLAQSFPGGQITARLRDAYVTWAPSRFFRLSVGQMITPWDLDSMRSDATLPFVSRAVPVEGVQPHEGIARNGLGLDRSLGISLHSSHMPLGTMASARYALMLANGNGQNQLLSNTNTPAFYGRVEFAFWGPDGLPPDRFAPMRAVTDEAHRPIVSVGLAVQYRPRTGGNVPDLIRETDTGAAADLVFNYVGIDLQAGLLYVRTAHDTLSSTPDTEQFGWWAHLRYEIPKIPIEITPGYRIASFSPFAHQRVPAPSEATARLHADFDLVYHTIGFTLRPGRTFPVHLALDYTFTNEKGANVLDNDRFEADVVAVFP
jgi:hypothetical protein